MDYIRIKTTRQQDNKTISRDVTPVASELTVNEVKELLKDWIKLYPNSFAPDVEFKIYQLSDGDIIIELHEDLSSMAVSLLVLYFDNIIGQQTLPIANSQQPTAFITIDDTEVLLKQNEGKRAMILGQRTTDNGQQTSSTVTEPVEVPTANSQQPTVASENKISDVTAVRFILEDNYTLDYNFEKRPQPVKDCDMVFEEQEFVLPEEYESIRVGEVVKKKIDEILEEGLTPKKMLIYILCAAIGLSIGFLIVYFMG